MPLKLSEAVYTNLLEKNYDKALKLRNRYAFINANLLPLLNKEEQELFMGFQDVYLKMEKEVPKYTDDVYPLLPKLGEHHMIQRMNPWDGIEGSCKIQLLLNIATSNFFPELDMALSASGILVGNSLFHNPNRTDIQEKALSEIYNGTAVGGIGITEMEHGSDAVNMKLKANIADNGDITYDGTKIYTTNGAVADYFSTYGVTDISNPRRTMMLTLFKREDEGLKTERLHIPGARGVGVGKVTYDNVTVPSDRMIAKPGDGYRRLFRGLTPERMVIVGAAIGGMWGALSHAAIFTQLRYQFGKPIFKYQGIGQVLADLYAKTAAYTAFSFQAADFYDKHISAAIHKGEEPKKMDEGTAAILAAQAKYLTSYFVHECTYECAQMMGGRGVMNEPGKNNYIERAENLARITEVLGGHRNIQLMIVQQGLKAGTAMAIGRNIRKAKKSHLKTQEKLTTRYMERAAAMLASEDVKFLSEKTKNKVEMALSKLKAAIETDNDIEMKAYAKALPYILKDAGKEIYKAKQ